MDEEMFDETEIGNVTNDVIEILKTAIKKDIIAEVTTLRRENERLREYEKLAYKCDIRLSQELQKLEDERKNLEKKVKNMQIRELFGDYISTAWCAQKVYTSKPKCDKCNADRKIEYTTPRGKKGFELCECAEEIITYNVHPVDLMTINTDLQWGMIKYNRQYYTAGTIWNNGERIEDSVKRVSTVYNDEPFDEIKKYYYDEMIFLDRIKCEEFCEYLNKKEQKKEQ